MVRCYVGTYLPLQYKNKEKYTLPQKSIETRLKMQDSSKSPKNSNSEVRNSQKFCLLPIIVEIFTKYSVKYNYTNLKFILIY